MQKRTGWAGFTSYVIAVFACGLGFLLTACSSGGTPAAKAASRPAKTTAPRPAAAAGTPAPVGSQPSSGPDAIPSVKADWTKFFDPTTPVARRISLLQNGAKFRRYLEVQARPGLAHLTTEQVSAVQIFGTMATVTYSILISGQSSGALQSQSGQAVFARAPGRSATLTSAAC